MKKKILPFIPARLRKGTIKWDILYYQTPPGENKRKPYRPTFDLNRIKNLREREKIGNRYVRKINRVLERGYPFCVDINGFEISNCSKEKKEDFSKNDLKYKNLEKKLDFLISAISQNSLNLKQKVGRINNLSNKNIIECIEKAKAIKMQSKYRTTRRSYKSHANLFINYLKKNNLENIVIGDFDKIKAMEYLDWWSEQGVVNNTWNNKLNHIRAIFTELFKRHYISVNPFFGIKEKDPSKVAKDCLTIKEMKILSPALKKYNIWLYWSINLASYLLIRQEELARIKFNFFNLKRGILHLPADVTKNKQEAYLTIPKFLLNEMINEGFFSSNFQNWYVFGKGLKPDPNESVDERESLK